MQSSKRDHLIEEGYIIDPPVVKRLHNRYRKDMPLTTEQRENLKEVYGLIVTKVKDNSGNYRDMTEHDVLVVLRKRYKKYKFTKVFLNINNLN